MKFELENMHDRRRSRVRVSTTLDEDSNTPPRMIGDEYFQTKRFLKTIIGVEFYSNGAQLKDKTRHARKLIQNHLFKDLIPIMDEILLESESEEVRVLVMRAKDIMLDIGE